MKITFEPSFPPEHLYGTEEVLKKLVRFITPHVQTLEVLYEREGEGEASIRVLRRYHRANVSLNAEFFRMDSEDRAYTLAHEIAHVLVDPISRELGHLIESFTEGRSYEYACMKLMDAEEKAVDCIALGMLQVLDARVDTESAEGDF